MQGLCIGLDECMRHNDGSSANKMSHESFAACLFRVIVVAFSKYSSKFNAVNKTTRACGRVSA